MGSEFILTQQHSERTMITRSITIIALSIALTSTAIAQELDGNYLYKVSTVRAATGELSGLLDWFKELRDSDYHDDAGSPFPLIMRHSQGDQWDLMIITPMESWTWYHSEPVSQKRENAAATHRELLARAETMVAFAEDHFAYGPPFSVVSAAYAENSFYHIEMFDAAPGKANELFQQRHMENAYLSATGQTTNLIFRRAAGSDVDVFTIGFHKDLEAFAAPASASDEQKEDAAIEAGFKNRADISFYLRSLLSAHHDTLAVKVE
jgi:hypothetical protein